MTSRLKGLDHIGVAVDDAEGLAQRLCEVLGAVHLGAEELDGEGLRVVSIRAGDAHLELFEPTRPEGSVRRFLDKRGNAMHHVCLEVEDLEGELHRLREAGVELIDNLPRRGAYGSQVAFIHPRATGGILFELSQKSPAG